MYLMDGHLIFLHTVDTELIGLTSLSSSEFHSVFNAIGPSHAVTTCLSYEVNVVYSN